MKFTDSKDRHRHRRRRARRRRRHHRRSQQQYVEPSDPASPCSAPRHRSPPAACAGAGAQVTVTHKGQVEEMTINAHGLPKNTDFDVFVTQLPNAPFGISWYQGDLESNAQGKAHVKFVGRFSVETFAVAPGTGVGTRRPRQRHDQGRRHQPAVRAGAHLPRRCVVQLRCGRRRGPLRQRAHAVQRRPHRGPAGPEHPAVRRHRRAAAPARALTPVASLTGTPVAPPSWARPAYRCVSSSFSLVGAFGSLSRGFCSGLINP